MRDVLLILLGIDAVAVLGVLLAGIFGLTAKDHNPRTSNKLMRWRVILQGVGIALVVALMLTG